MSIIICGSRKYTNVNFDSLVDSFGLIIRNNFLLPDMGYGKRNPDMQVCNIHVYRHFQKKTNAKALFVDYRGKKMTLEHAKKVHEFFHCSGIKVVHYKNNNESAFSEVNQKHSLNYEVKGLAKCGLSHVVECILLGFKPFLVGYSVRDDQVKSHAYNNHVNLYKNHDHDAEISFMKELHKKGLVDATFCLVEDKQPLTLSNEFSPTKEGLEILNEHLR
tara:strand:- start:801 stop:1454 length:654 start_codon:yes stop_codon:yes gene_type:complete